MKILIVCDTDEGRATELTLFLKCEADRMNRRVVVLNAHEVSRRPVDFDAIIVLGEMEKITLGEPVTDYIRANLSALNLIPSFFIPVLSCDDENNLKVPDGFRESVRELLVKLQWAPQQVLTMPVGVRLQSNEFVTLADWSALKLSLQRFLVRNDFVMAG